MFEYEQFPESFNETTLHMLWKSKGRPEILEIIDLYIVKNGGQELQKVLWWKTG